MKTQKSPRRAYSPNDYDVYLALKVPVAMWLALVFLARPYVVLIMSLANRREPMSLIETLYADRTLLLVDAVTALPVILIVMAWLRRRPGAGKLTRTAWHSGRVLFSLSALAATTVSVILVVRSHAWDLNAWHVLQAMVSVAILLYALWSRRVHDTFREFPLPPQPGENLRPTAGGRRRRHRAQPLESSLVMRADTSSHPVDRNQSATPRESHHGARGPGSSSG